MNIYDATEQAYKNGYKQGMKDALNGVVISNLETTTKWISVKDRLPEQERTVLVVDRITGEVTTAHLNVFGSFVFKDGRGHGASHWMPLPQPPKEENKC